MLAEPIKAEQSPISPGMVRLTYICMCCDVPNQIDVERYRYESMIHSDRLLQDIFPEMSDSQREIFITGAHAKCFAELFVGEDDDSDNRA